MPRPYLIVSVGRTGSTILTDALARTGRLGAPAEHLLPDNQRRFAAEFGVVAPRDGGSMRGYLDALIAETATPNGCVGTTVHSPWFGWLARGLAAEDTTLGDDMASILRATFPGWVVLWSRRRDRAATVVSSMRAEASQRWRRHPGAPEAEPDVEVSIGEVSERHRALHRSDVIVGPLLARVADAVHEVVYEDLVADWEGQLVATRRFLGDGHLDEPVPPPSLAKQAGPQSDAQLRRWVEATGGCAACGHQANAAD